MKTRNYLLTLPSVVMAFTSLVASASNNIVLNGDFEIVDLRSPPNFFPPWHFSSGLTGYVGEPGAASGRNCVFVGGSSYGGDMWQDLQTEIGQTYQLSFYERGDEWEQSERVSLLNVLFGQVVVGSYARDNIIRGWNYHTFTVVAESAITRLDFQNASQT